MNGYSPLCVAQGAADAGAGLEQRAPGLSAEAAEGVRRGAQRSRRLVPDPFQNLTRPP